MKVFLLRHSIAAYGGPDPDRSLTQEGQHHAESLARFIRDNSFFDYEEVWCSPYRRARQTAKPFMDEQPGPINYQEMDCLVPFGEPMEVLSKLIELHHSVLIVGHNPHLSQLARILLGVNQSHVHLPFKKSGLMAFKRDPFSQTGYSLAGYLTPKSIGIKH